MAPTEPWPLSLAMHVSELERRVHNQIRLNGESPITPREQQNRFLCVSDGFSIYCLDLDQAGGDFIDYAETLPVVSTINLLEERLPIASALFQLGSAGLMIGGKEIHKFEQPTDRLMLPEEIFNKYNFKGSSKATYQLFLAEGKLHISINYCFPELSCPKSWPIVEQIGNQLHVIESIPHFILHQTHDWIPSHEVLDLDDLARGWKEVSYMGPLLPHSHCKMFMRDELVLGDKIFAVPQLCFIFNYYTLDCKTNDDNDNRCWEFHDSVSKDRQLQVSPRFHVSHLLNRGSFICVGWFDKLVPGYAVIGFQNCISEDEDDDGLDVIAMAVLVTPSGEVICHQSLPGFFDGIKPIDMHKATIFRVGDSTTSSTMFCVVLMGDYYSRTEPGSERVLYISTFCVEEANLEGGFSGSLEEVEERKFLKIVLKKRQMYKLGRNFGFGADPDSDFCPTLRLTACFI